MSDTLRSKLIRLAHANPSLRSDILPLLEKKAGVSQGQLDELYGEMTEGFAHSKAQIWQGAIDTLIDGEEEESQIKKMIEDAKKEVVANAESTAKAALAYLGRKIR